MCSLSCNLVSYGHIWTNGGREKKQFCASATLSVKNEFWPSSSAAQFYFQVHYHSVSANTSVPCTPFDRMQFFTHFNISKCQEKKWAAEPQRKKSNLLLRIKMGRVLGLTFLLSSISCSNMALNTGERAESSHMGEKLPQQQRHLRNQQHWILPQLLQHKHFQLLQQGTSSSVQHLLRDGNSVNSPLA